jgi:hypothetical protein
MTITLQEVCKSLASFLDLDKLRKSSKKLASKTNKASKELGLSVSVYGKAKLRLRKADHSTITYTNIPNPESKEIQTIILTHAILTHKLHDPERTNRKNTSITRRRNRL